MSAQHVTAVEPARGGLIDGALLAKLEEELASSFAGDLIGPQSPSYEEARTVWNAMVDKRPGLIARCTKTTDVVAVVNAARRHRLALSVRGGGHSVSGKAFSDGALAIDLSGMRGVEVDAERALVRVQGGCLLADVDEGTAPHGLIVPVGVVSDTGVVGLALGGGIGWFSRKHGLTCDNFESLEVVVASGEVIEASASEHSELFWALRGGGGNFGVVTRVTFRAHQFGPMIRVGISLYRPEDAREALRAYARILPTLPRTIGWHAVLKHDMLPEPFLPAEMVGERLLMLFSMWLEDADDREGAALIERLTEVGDPCLKVSRVTPFGLGVQRALDLDSPDGKRNYTKEAHLTEIPDEAIDLLVDFWKGMPMDGEMVITALGGAIGDVPEAASAFSRRQYLSWLTFAMHWDDASHDEDYIGRTREVAKRLEPWIGTGVYVNMLNFDEMDRVIEAFGGPEKYAKLGRIKAKYDPGNLFHINYNIVPVFD
jgi:FAD/FMN-containing dehydrogenase